MSHNSSKNEIFLEQMKEIYMYQCKKTKLFFFYEIDSFNSIYDLLFNFYVGLKVDKLQILRVETFLDPKNMSFYLNILIDTDRWNNCFPIKFIQFYVDLKVGKTFLSPSSSKNEIFDN